MAVAVGECLLLVLVGVVWMRTRKDPVAGEGLFITDYYCIILIICKGCVFNMCKNVC